ncbi:MAG: endonuclease/exonuclease/phosphatase family protein [Chitinispirillaceae bacterium]
MKALFSICLLSATVFLNGFFFCTDETSESRGFQKKAALPDTFSAAFYNVENLFDFKLDGTEYEEYRPGRCNWTENIQKTKVSHTAEVIATLDADIIGLCEVENSRVLEQLRGELEKWGCSYPYKAAALSKGAANTTALLSRFPVKKSREHPVRQSRSILEASIAGFRVFVNHWPSKRHPESDRMNAARVLRKRLDQLPPETEYIILGDLNSNYDESATFHTAGFNDTQGKTGINHVLETTRNDTGTAIRFVRKADLADCRKCHYNLWLDLSLKKRMSYVYRGSHETMDNMLLPRTLFDSKGISYIDSSFGTFTCKGQLIRNGTPYRWQMRYRGEGRFHTGRGFSDHLPVSASFVKGAYSSADAEDSVPSENSFIGDFESGRDGWICCDSRFSIARDTVSLTGHYSLAISGLHAKANKTAAKARLRGAENKTHLHLEMKGSGKISIRIRRSPEDRWTYFNGPRFRESKRARYRKWESRQWGDLKLRLPRKRKPSGDVYVELRSGKKTPLRVWIDHVGLK